MASGNISVSKSSISSCPESTRINLMACEIEHDGEAQVASYFDTSVREEEANSGVQNSVKGMYALFMKRPHLWLGESGRSGWGVGAGTLPLMAWVRTPSILWMNHHLFLQDALPKRGAFFRIQVYERVGISPVEVYEMVGKSVIWVCEKAKKG